MRKLSLILVVLFSLIGGTALAQEVNEPYCGELATEDCDLLQQSAEQMETLNEATFRLQVDLFIEDPTASEGQQTMPIGLIVDGRYEIDRTLLPEGTTMQLEDPFSAITDAVESISADVQVSVNLPEDMTDTIEPLTFQSRLVDGTGYLNMDAFGNLMQDSGSNVEGWHGANIPELLNALGDSGMAMSGFTSGFASGLSAGSEFAEEALEYTQIERLDNEMVEGNETAVFLTTFDLGGYLSDEDVLEATREQAREQLEAAGQTPTDEQVEQATALQGQLFSGVTLDTYSYIDLESLYQRQQRLEMDLSSVLNMAMLATSGQSSSGGSLTLDLTLTRDNFNEASEIVAPEDATRHTADELFGAFGMALPGMGMSG